MSSEVSQQRALVSRVERLVERAIAFAIDERDDDLAVARLAWLAQDDLAALEEASEVCLGCTEVGRSSEPGRPGCWPATMTLASGHLGVPVPA
jgi:hypothetical protein